MAPPPYPPPPAGKRACPCSQVQGGGWGEGACRLVGSSSWVSTPVGSGAHGCLSPWAHADMCTCACRWDPACRCMYMCMCTGADNRAVAPERGILANNRYFACKIEDYCSKYPDLQDFWGSSCVQVPICTCLQVDAGAHVLAHVCMHPLACVCKWACAHMRGSNILLSPVHEGF